ncbi:MAG: glycosyltransferase family 2 protein [Porphyrobacter sp.]|nr:glycosyltransferase family 2 protein [Porphyrobacter sp.]
MTKLVIQIPCLNEAEALPATLAALPRRIEGIDEIEFLVIDDGSTDGTSEIARLWGVHHIVRHRRNRGLAAAFRSGIEAALAAGADIIVNTDADGQYEGGDIALLVAPVLSGEADIVVGDRGVAGNAHFSPFKRLLQRLGSAVVQRLAGAAVPDAVSGFRAISRDAAQRINITTEFSYTTDMLIQAGRKRMAIKSMPIRTNRTERPSRLFKSIPRFIANTGVTMLRAYATHNPLRAFMTVGLFIAAVGLLPIIRFLWFWTAGAGEGHVQSLVLGGALLVLGTLVAILGMIADLIGSNRKLLEANLVRLRQIEDRLDAAMQRNSDISSAQPFRSDRKDVA